MTKRIELHGKPHLFLTNIIRSLTSSFSSLNWSWISREANAAADAVAGLASRNVCPLDWLHSLVDYLEYVSIRLLPSSMSLLLMMFLLLPSCSQPCCLFCLSLCLCCLVCFNVSLLKKRKIISSTPTIHEGAITNDLGRMC